MNRDEILARSRAENQGNDEYERAVLEKAGRISAKAGMLACCAVALLEVAVTGRVSFASWLIYFSILASTFWVKYRCQRQKHELAVALIYTGLGIFFASLFVLDLWGQGCG